MKSLFVISKFIISVIQFINSVLMIMAMGSLSVLALSFGSKNAVNMTTTAYIYIIFCILFSILFILNIVLLVKYFKGKNILKLNNITSIISIIISLILILIEKEANNIIDIAFVSIIINTILLFIFNNKKEV